MEAELSCVPPGFRFHPTEEELVGYYLNRKINSLKIDLDVIIEIDLYRIEPWDIQDKCKLGYEEQNEWYFFSHKDRKYPTGRRTNRATSAGFWKATGRDKAVVSKKESVIGMRKTLVFYKGRAPTGMKTDWIMHEYRLQSSEHGPPQEEGWVVCRAFKKATPNQRQGNEGWNGYYDLRNNNSFASPNILNESTNYNYHIPFDHLHHTSITHFDNEEAIDLPQLDSPTTISTTLDTRDQDNNNCIFNHVNDMNINVHNFSTSQPIIFPFPNMPLIPCDHHDELDSQNHMNHLLACFPDF